MKDENNFLKKKFLQYSDTQISFERAEKSPLSFVTKRSFSGMIDLMKLDFMGSE